MEKAKGRRLIFRGLFCLGIVPLIVHAATRSTCVCSRYTRDENQKVIRTTRELYTTTDPKRIRACDQLLPADQRAPEILKIDFDCRLFEETLPSNSQGDMEWTFPPEKAPAPSTPSAKPRKKSSGDR